MLLKANAWKKEFERLASDFIKRLEVWTTSLKFSFDVLIFSDVVLQSSACNATPPGPSKTKQSIAPEQKTKWVSYKKKQAVDFLDIFVTATEVYIAKGINGQT
jgi:hypothetical protein